MSITFADYVATRPDAALRQAEVLSYTESLVDSLDTHFRLYTAQSHRDSVNKSTDDFSVSHHQKCLDQIREGTYDYHTKFYIIEGRKYLRIEMETGVNHDGSVTQKSIHAFVDKNTGEVYKSASWKTPAKGVRFNLLDAQSRENCYRRADWAGGYLYK